ncbi:MAG: methyltransferase domain-containing protein [Bryobacteraceae bacterium]
MSIEKWNERYRACKQLSDTPEPLVERFAADLAPGTALDLACGPGRNSLCLAERGWRVTAVDGSPIAIAKLRSRFGNIDARVADLERGEFQIEPDSYDLICDCLYLQRDLFPKMKAGIRAGGMAIVTVLLAGAGTPTRVCPGELRAYFEDWKILHYLEESVAELVAVR